MTDLKDSKMSDIKTQKEENPYCYAWFVAIIFISLILIYGVIFIGQLKPENKADLGVLGDYIGGVLNPIISFIALLFLIKTFTTQKEAFELQKEELELTREELKKQNETMEFQRFETTFFNLLEWINNQFSDIKSNDFNEQKAKSLASSIEIIFELIDGLKIKNQEEKNKYIKLVAVRLFHRNAHNDKDIKENRSNASKIWNDHIKPTFDNRGGKFREMLDDLASELN